MGLFKKEPKMFRQGDVLLREIPMPKALGDEIPRDKDKVVLAYGEVTGHAHALASPDVSLFALPQMPSNVRALIVKKDAVLSHEEHLPITIPAGSYEIVQQREWSDEDERVVAD